MSRPWMPLYVADYLAGTSHLSTVEHGAYMLMIMHYWQKGGLPADEAKLARICRMSASEWDRARPTLADMFTAGWRHERIDKEIAEAEAKYNRRALAGQKGGNAKANRQHWPGPDGGDGVARLDQPQLQPQPQPQAQAQPQPQPQLQLQTSAGGAALDDLDLVEWLRAAIGLDPAPGLKNAAPLRQLLAEGYTAEAHFVPVGKRLVAQGRRFRSWAYIMAPVREAASPSSWAAPAAAEARPKLTAEALAAEAQRRQFVVLDTPEWERRCQALRAVGKLPPNPYYSKEVKANGAWLPREDPIPPAPAAPQPDAPPAVEQHPAAASE
jgi:uncharacterized protein YdaU (DUF1376 family)